MPYREGVYDISTHGGGRLAGVVFRDVDGKLSDIECIRVNNSRLSTEVYDLEPSGPPVRLSPERRAVLLAEWYSLPR
mgnify:FL=1